MNIIQIIGHLGADPETRFTPSGQKITNLRIASNSRRQGKEETIWWRVTIFGDRFDKMLSYLKKGSAIIVIGKMNPPQIWTDKEGKQHVQLEVIADMVEFSPIGKSGERSNEQAGGFSAPGAQINKEKSFSGPSYSADSASSHSPQFDTGYSPFGAPSQYDAGEREEIPF